MANAIPRIVKKAAITTKVFLKDALNNLCIKATKPRAGTENIPIMKATNWATGIKMIAGKNIMAWA